MVLTNFESRSNLFVYEIRNNSIKEKSSFKFYPGILANVVEFGHVCIVVFAATIEMQL